MNNLILRWLDGLSGAEYVSLFLLVWFLAAFAFWALVRIVVREEE